MPLGPKTYIFTPEKSYIPCPVVMDRAMHAMGCQSSWSELKHCQAVTVVLYSLLNKAGRMAFVESTLHGNHRKQHIEEGGELLMPAT